MERIHTASVWKSENRLRKSKSNKVKQKDESSKAGLETASSKYKKGQRGHDCMVKTLKTSRISDLISKDKEKLTRDNPEGPTLSESSNKIEEFNTSCEFSSGDCGSRKLQPKSTSEVKHVKTDSVSVCELPPDESCLEYCKRIFSYFSIEKTDSDSDYLHLRSDDHIKNKFYSHDSTALSGSWLTGNKFQNFNPNRTLIWDKLLEFVKMPVSIGFLVKCRVTRYNKGFDHGIFPIYTLHLENDNDSENRILLMTARKRKKTTTQKFLISLDPFHLGRGEDSIIGFVWSNLLGTEFTVCEFDRGSSAKIDNTNPKNIELAAVQYERYVIGKTEPRKMKILLPTMLSETKRLEREPGDNHVLGKCRNGLAHGVMELMNRTPLYNNTTGQHMLNFQGNNRVTVSSVKNFQIFHPENDDYIVLQFGRVSNNEFTLDIRFPLCPLQAFGLALSSITPKLGCK